MDTDSPGNVKQIISWFLSGLLIGYSIFSMPDTTGTRSSTRQDSPSCTIVELEGCAYFCDLETGDLDSNMEL